MTLSMPNAFGLLIVADFAPSFTVLVRGSIVSGPICRTSSTGFGRGISRHVLISRLARMPIRLRRAHVRGSKQVSQLFLDAYNQIEDRSQGSRTCPDEERTTQAATGGGKLR